MREIELIDELEYNHKFLLLREGKELDRDNVLCEKVKLVKNVYSSDELLFIDETLNEISSSVANSFIETFKNRGGATKEQIHFANETAKTIFGVPKEKFVAVIPAPCGFGKSSITLEILKKIIEMYKLGLTTDGVIIVTDRLESLRDTQKELEDMDLEGYTYILESWNEQICKNKKIKRSDSKMCTPDRCSFFYDCKIYKQHTDQAEKPILLITNARLKECGESLKRFKDYEGGKRKTLIIDERPDLLDVLKVNQSLLNEIRTELSTCEYGSTKDKTILENKFKEICDTLTVRMQRLRAKYKRFVLSNICNENICKADKEFMSLWNKYMGNKMKRELDHIHKVLTSGGFYVYEKKTEFITTIGSIDLNEMYSDTFKTIIFDGTALYDPLYLSMYEKGGIRFLDIENTRLYNNLSITSYNKHKLTRTSFNDKNYLLNACAEFINNKMKFHISKAYVVTYQNQATKLSKLLRYKDNIPQPNESETFYFGNTKGKNAMQDCTTMFQMGWNALPDYEYVIQWLSASSVNWQGVLELCANIEKAEEVSELLTIKDRRLEQSDNNIYGSQFKSYEYGLQDINQFKLLALVTEFYQEVHRTKLRKYNCQDYIEVHVFTIQPIILKMIERIFPLCRVNVVEDDLVEFKESKIDNRANGGNAKILKNFIENVWEYNEILTSKQIYEGSGLTKDQFQNLKRNNSYFIELFKKYWTDKKGKYKKIR